MYSDPDVGMVPVFVWPALADPHIYLWLACSALQHFWQGQEGKQSSLLIETASTSQHRCDKHPEAVSCINDYQDSLVNTEECAVLNKLHPLA